MNRFTKFALLLFCASITNASASEELMTWSGIQMKLTIPDCEADPVCDPEELANIIENTDQSVITITLPDGIADAFSLTESLELVAKQRLTECLRTTPVDRIPRECFGILNLAVKTFDPISPVLKDLQNIPSLVDFEAALSANFSNQNQSRAVIANNYLRPLSLDSSSLSLMQAPDLQGQTAAYHALMSQSGINAQFLFPPVNDDLPFDPRVCQLILCVSDTFLYESIGFSNSFSGTNGDGLGLNFHSYRPGGICSKCYGHTAQTLDNFGLTPNVLTQIVRGEGFLQPDMPIIQYLNRR